MNGSARTYDVPITRDANDKLHRVDFPLRNISHTQRTKDTKASEINHLKLRDLRVLRGKSLLCVLFAVNFSSAASPSKFSPLSAADRTTSRRKHLRWHWLSPPQSARWGSRRSLCRRKASGPSGLSTKTVFSGGTSAMDGNLDSPKVNVAILPSTIGFSSINAKPKPVTMPPSICPVR